MPTTCRSRRRTNSCAGKVLQELLATPQSVYIGLVLPVNSVFFWHIWGGGVWVRRTLNQTSHSSAVPCRVQWQQSLTVTMGMNGRSGVRNSRREEREEAATATEASSHPSPLYCLKYAPQLRENSLVRFRNSRVFELLASRRSWGPANKEVSAENLCGSNFVLKIDLTLTWEPPPPESHQW